MTRKWAALAATLAATALVVGCFSKEAASIRNRLAVDYAADSKSAKAALETSVMRDIQNQTALKLGTIERNYRERVAAMRTRQEVAAETARYMRALEDAEVELKAWSKPLIAALATVDLGDDVVLALNDMANREIAGAVASREAILDGVESAAMAAIDAYIRRGEQAPDTLAPDPTRAPIPTPAPTPMWESEY